MFDKIDIHLTEPICSCKIKEYAKEYTWSIVNDHTGKSSLKLSCKNCGTSLIVSNDKFCARFIVDNNIKLADEPKADVPKVDIQPKQVSIDSGKPPWAKD